MRQRFLILALFLVSLFPLSCKKSTDLVTEALVFPALPAKSKDTLRTIIEVLKHVETGNNPALVGDGGDSWGVLQIQWPAVQDVNRYYGTQYTHYQMFKPECAEEVAILYMKMGANLYRQRHGKEPSIEVLVRNHNGGIYQGYKNPKTKWYYRKYLIWKTRLYGLQISNTADHVPGLHRPSEVTSSPGKNERVWN